MNLMTYAKVSLINLLFLTIGIAIGGAYFGRSVQIVYAKQSDQSLTPSSPYSGPGVSNNAEYLLPDIETGVGAFSRLLANRIAADDLVVRGIDILRMNELTLELLREKGIADTARLQRLVNDSQTGVVLKLAPPKKK